jgi:hypothetical protein
MEFYKRSLLKLLNYENGKLLPKKTHEILTMEKIFP